MRASFAFPVLLSIFSVVASLPLSLLLAFALGFAIMSHFTLINTLLQTRVDDRLRGRVMSLMILAVFGFSPFGNLALGALSEYIGLTLSMAAFALTYLVLAAAIHRRVPEMRTLA
jgi:MFS family permease